MSYTISLDFKTYLYELVEKYGNNKELKQIMSQLKEALDGLPQNQSFETAGNNKVMNKIKELQNIKLKLDKQAQQQVDEIVRLQDMKTAIQKEIEKQQIMVNERKEQILNQEMANKQISQNITQLNQKINDIQQQIQQNEYSMQLEEQHHHIRIKELEYNHAQHIENLQKQIQILKNEKVIKSEKIKLLQIEQQQTQELAKKQYTKFKDEMIKQIEEKQNLISKMNQQNLNNQIQLNKLINDTKQMQADYFKLEMVIPGIKHQIQYQNEKKLNAQQTKLQKEFEAHIHRKENEVSHNDNIRRIEMLQSENVRLKTQLKELNEDIETSQKSIQKNYVGKYHNYLIQNEKINRTVVIKKIELMDLKKLLVNDSKENEIEEEQEALLEQNSEQELLQCQKTLRELFEQEKKLQDDITKLQAMRPIEEIVLENADLKKSINKLIAKQNSHLRELKQKQDAINTQNQIIQAKELKKNIQKLTQKKPENEMELQQLHLMQRCLNSDFQKKVNVMGQISQMKQPGKILK